MMPANHTGRVAHGLSRVELQEMALACRVCLSEDWYLRIGLASLYLRRAGGLWEWRVDWACHADRCADHRILLRPPGKHHRRYQHNTKLGDFGSDECHHHSRELCIDLRDWLDVFKSVGDDYIHTDGQECRWFGNCDSDSYRDRDRDGDERSVDQFVHSQPLDHCAGWRQLAEQGHLGSDEHYDYAGNVRINIRKRNDKREPAGDDHLHSHGDQYRGLEHGNCDGDRGSTRRAAEDHDGFMPGWNAEQRVRWMHDHCQRRNSSLHIQREHELQLSSTA